MINGAGLFIMKQMETTQKLVCLLLLALSVRPAADTTPPPGALRDALIADFRVASEKPYDWSLLSEGSLMYIDRDYTYTAVPDELRGRLVLVPSNYDKYYDAVDTVMRFRVKKKVKIYIVYSHLYTHLTDVWLHDRGGWQPEEMTVQTSLAPHKASRRVKSKVFEAGDRVQLGGNGCVLRNCDMYTLVIVPLDS